MMVDGMGYMDGGMYSGPVDHQGVPVKNTKHEYPYSYDPYVTMGVPGSKYMYADYSDRLIQWDRDKFSRLSKVHFGNEGKVFYDRTIDKIEAFLQDYHADTSLKLVMVAEGANQSTGYPYWVFFYNNKEG